jgi:DNA-binding response OmpR family regulator
MLIALRRKLSMDAVQVRFAPVEQSQEECLYRILLLENDISMRSKVTAYMQDRGVKVIPAALGASSQVCNQIKRSNPSLIILDLCADKDKSFSILESVRQCSNVPIILTSSQWCEEADRIIGLELGADDYLTKPYGLRELLARIRAVLRRHARRRTKPLGSVEGGTYKFYGWQLEARARRLTNPNGAQVPLTNGEYALLIAFLDAPERPLSREHLLRATRMHEDIFDRSLNVQILRLRRKLEADPSNPQMIRTIVGMGYMLAVPVQRLGHTRVAQSSC